MQEAPYSVGYWHCLDLRYVCAKVAQLVHWLTRDVEFFRVWLNLSRAYPLQKGMASEWPRREGTSLSGEQALTIVGNTS